MSTFLHLWISRLLVLSMGGAEDVTLIEYAHLTGRPFRVFSLDTGRLNPETYQFFDTVDKHHNIRIEYMFPDAVKVQGLVRSKGLFFLLRRWALIILQSEESQTIEKGLKRAPCLDHWVNEGSIPRYKV